MHNTFENFQLETTLDRAKRNLQEAVDITNMQEKRAGEVVEEKIKEEER